MGIYRNLWGFGGLVVKKWLKILVALVFHLGSIKLRENYTFINLK